MPNQASQDEQKPGKQKRFDPNDHIIQIKNRGGAPSDYLPVQYRLVWINDRCIRCKITILDKFVDPTIEVEKEVEVFNKSTNCYDKTMKRAKGLAWVHIRVEDDQGKVGEAIKLETAVDFPDYLEKADTGATGRALAKIGYGTQFVGDEFNELPDRIVDAPVPVDQASPKSASTRSEKDTQSVQASQSAQPTTVTEALATAKATPQQRKSINKLLQSLGSPELASDCELSYAEAKERITTLSAEYNERRQQKASSPVPLSASTSGTPPSGADMDVQALIEKLVQVIPGPYEQQEFLAGFCGLERKDPREHSWNQVKYTHVRAKLVEWLSSDHRRDWLALPKSPEQFAEMNGVWNKKYGSKPLIALRDCDRFLKGKLFGSFTREEADIFIGYVRRAEPDTMCDGALVVAGGIPEDRRTPPEPETTEQQPDQAA